MFKHIIRPRPTKPKREKHKNRNKILGIALEILTEILGNTETRLAKNRSICILGGSLCSLSAIANFTGSPGVAKEKNLLC